MKTQTIRRNPEHPKDPHPANSILPSQINPVSTGGGVGGRSLPLSLEIVATNISHIEAGSEDGGVIACRLVANDLLQFKAGW